MIVPPQAILLLHSRFAYHICGVEEIFVTLINDRFWRTIWTSYLARHPAILFSFLICNKKSIQIIKRILENSESTFYNEINNVFSFSRIVENAP